MSSNGSQNSLIQFTGWLARKLMWGILILLVLAGLGAAGYWLYVTDVTHVILQCEWEEVDQDDPTGALITYDRHYVVKKERFSDRIKALYGLQVEIKGKSKITGIEKLYNVMSQDQDRYVFGTYSDLHYRLMRKTTEMFRYEGALFEAGKELVKRGQGSPYIKRMLEQFDDAGWRKASGCKIISQSDLDRVIASRVEKIRAEQKF